MTRCVDLGSEVARRSRVAAEESLPLTRYATSPAFAEHGLVLTYAESITPVDVPTTLIAVESLRGRCNLALGAEFGQGRVYALPGPGPGRHRSGDARARDRRS